MATLTNLDGLFEPIGRDVDCVVCGLPLPAALVALGVDHVRRGGAPVHGQHLSPEGNDVSMGGAI